MEIKKYKFIKNLFKLIKIKIFSDFLFNYLSLIFLGISGLFLNLIIANFYDPSTLGIFNLAITFYFLISMIGSGGVNYSVLYSLSKSKKYRRNKIYCFWGCYTCFIYKHNYCNIIFKIYNSNFSFI